MKALLIAARPQTRQLLDEALKRRGHEVKVVEDGDAACAALRSGGYRLVVLEAGAANGEDVQLCRRLREAPRDGPCVILAAGASPQPERVEALLAAGADDYLAGLDDTRWLELRLAVAEHQLQREQRRQCGEELWHRASIDCCSMLYDAPCGVFRADAEGRFLDANPALATMLGYDSREELAGVDVVRTICQDPAECQRLLARLRDQGLFDGVEVEWKRRDGSRIVLLKSARAVHDETGRFVEIQGIAVDITAQKQAERSHEASWTRLQHLLSSSPAMIYTCAASGDYPATYVSENVKAHLGYEAREFVEDRRFWSDHIHPDDLARVMLDLEKLFETGNHAHEYRFLHKDGSYRCMHDELKLLRDSAGRPLEIVGFWMDVTEQRQAEEALRESEQRFRTLFDSAVDGILLADVETREFTICNCALCRMLGYSQEEIKTLAVDDIHPKDELPRVLAEFRSQAAGEHTLARELPVKRKDGSVFYADINTFRINLAGRAMLAGAFRDVTERKQAEQALQESEAKLRSLLENLPDVIVMVNQTGMVQFANHDLPNMPTQALIGRNVLDFVAPEYRQPSRDLVEQVFSARQTQTIDALDIYGSWWACTIVPMIEEGRPPGAMVIATDVTQQRKATQALKKERQLLRRLLDLHERDRQLTAYEIHDGFSQYLTAAMYNLQGFRELQASNPQRAQRTFDLGLSLIRRGINEARRLISGLRPPILDESGIVAAVDYLACEAAESHEAEVEFIHQVKFQRLAPPLESAVFRIVQESLANARRHSRSKKIRIELLQDGDCIRIAVRDWGIGFNPSKVEEGRFGLQGIRERARLFGGRVTIETGPGKGTLVSAELPLVEAVGETAQA